MKWFKNPKKMLLILLMFSLNGASHGLTNGNLSTDVIKMYQNVQFVEQDDLFAEKDDWRISFITVSYFVGSMIGSALVSYLKPRLGGRMLVRYCSYALLLTNILMCIPVHWIFLSISRLLIAIPVFLMDAAVPIWLSQLAEYRFRGLLGSSFQISFGVGLLISGLILWAIFPGCKHDEAAYKGTYFFFSFVPTFIFAIIIIFVTYKFDDS